MKEALVYTNDGHVALYKYGERNKVVERASIDNPLDLFTKQGEEENVYQVDKGKREMPIRIEDLELERSDLLVNYEARQREKETERKRREEEIAGSQTEDHLTHL